MDKSESILIVASYLSSKSLEAVKSQVINFMADRPKDELYFEFINWHGNANELIVYTDYSSLDVVLPTTINAVRKVDRPDQLVKVNGIVKYAVFNGWMPIRQLSSGHKDLCILEFANGIPEVFRELSELSEARRSHRLEIVVG